jgi:hypothetical protein
MVLTLVLSIACDGEGFAQTKKEMTFSGTHYFSSTPKAFQLGPGQSITHLEVFGVKVNGSGDGPFHNAICSHCGGFV